MELREVTIAGSGVVIEGQMVASPDFTRKHPIILIAAGPLEDNQSGLMHQNAPVFAKISLGGGSQRPKTAILSEFQRFAA